eukprot:COSAG05_NODE_1596_length_4455_cov_3.362259_6_plen_141_part_00
MQVTRTRLVILVLRCSTTITIVFSEYELRKCGFETIRRPQDPAAKPWRQQPAISGGPGADSEDTDGSLFGTGGGAPPAPPWPEDGTLPPAQQLVEAVLLPPHDPLQVRGGAPFRDSSPPAEPVLCERPLGTDSRALLYQR